DFQRIPKFFREKEACFLFLTEGAFHFRTPTKEVYFKEGDGLLAQCGNYYIEKHKTYDSNDDLSFIGAYFYPDIVKSFFQSDIAINQFSHPFDATKVNMEPMLKTFLESLHFIFDNPLVADENMIVNKLKELLLLLSKSEKAKSIHTFIHSLFDPYQHNFETIIQNNIYSSLSIKENSHLCNYSVSTFKRKFKAIYNTTPANYFLEKKLAKAIQLLKLKNLPVSEVAYQCGFQNISSFNKTFKRKFALTPSEYRLNQKDNLLNL
ncbi:MAG: AraC family transcriptional regulator, partial [Flavobacteriaceae bacterium]